MPSASHDNNGIPTLICASSADGITIVPVQVGATNHGVSVSDATTGTDFGRSVAVRDNNRVTVLMAVSSADGITPVEVYADSSGNLLVNSN